MCDCSFHVIGDAFYHFVTSILGVFVANFCSDSKAGRNGHPEKVHFGEVSAFAAEEVSHICVAFCFTVTECIYSFHSIKY